MRRRSDVTVAGMILGSGARHGCDGGGGGRVEHHLRHGLPRLSGEGEPTQGDSVRRMPGGGERRSDAKLTGVGRVCWQLWNIGGGQLRTILSFKAPVLQVELFRANGIAAVATEDYIEFTCQRCMPSTTSPYRIATCVSKHKSQVVCQPTKHKVQVIAN